MFIKSNILRSGNAFSTRCGGVSTQKHTSTLNLAFDRGDDDATVLSNLEIFAKAAGFDPTSIVSHPQIHSDKLLLVDETDKGGGYYIRKDIEGCDGYVTNKKGVVLGIKTADCVPILFEAERDGEIIAIGAAHAGWRGTVSNIAGKCAERLCAEFGAKKTDIRAVIGPCIHSCCYEVDKDVFDAVRSDLGEDIAKDCICAKPNGKYMCDLAKINLTVLSRCGLKRENIEIIDECTCCNPEKFFSHRYSNGHRGTMLNVIFLKQYAL